MIIQQKKLTTSEEYTNFVSEFVTLLDEQFRIFEDQAKNKENFHILVHQIPAITSLVNTVGYLRGQDGMFLDIRPITENQREFYEYEDFFVKRLNTLINILKDWDEKDLYKDKLESYLHKE